MELFLLKGGFCLRKALMDTFAPLHMRISRDQQTRPFERIEKRIRVDRSHHPSSHHHRRRSTDYNHVVIGAFIHDLESGKLFCKQER